MFSALIHQPGIPKRIPGFSFRLLKRYERLAEALLATPCPVCQTFIEPGEWPLCPACRERLELFQAPHCLRCRRPLPENRNCPDCHTSDADRLANAPLTLWSRGAFRGSLRSAILAVKFGGRRDLASPLADPLISMLAEILREGPAPVLLPVPLHPNRMKQRGFNLPERWCRRLALATGIPLRSALLVRQVDTPSQVGLPFDARILNVRGAFACPKPEAIQGLHVVLVDDVATTGATLNAAAAPCLEAGATVTTLTLAQALHD